MRRIFKVILVIVFLGILFFALRYPMMRTLGNYLVSADEVVPVEVLFLLSGNPFERPNHAAELFHLGYTDYIVCTGEIIPYNLIALGYEMHEGQLSKNQLIKNGVPAEQIFLIEQGRSTWEEANVILEYSLEHNLTQIGVLSSSFHTRRIRQTFRRVFRNSGVEFKVFSAPVENFDPNHWWKSESGLITLNNEYMKIFYYRLKY